MGKTPTYEQLLEKINRLETLIENMESPVGIYDNTGLLKMINKSGAALFEATPEKMVGKSVSDLFPNTSDQYRQRIKNVTHTGKSESHIDQLHRSSGDRWVRSNFIPVIKDGIIEAVQVVYTDITERKMAETERQRLMFAIEQIEEIVSITDARGIIQYVNPAFEKITGFQPQDAIGKNPRILKSGYHNQSFYKDLWDTILSGNRWTGHFNNKRRDGSLYLAECSISPVMDQNGQIQNFIWISRDITAAAKIDERLNQSQKMEAIGALAGGIAHDFNNILSSIIGFTELSLDDAPEDSMLADNMGEVYKAGKRAKELVKQILTFARQTGDEVRLIKVDTIAKEVTKFIRSSIPATIQIKPSIQSDSLIMGNATQIYQVLMNLCTNAAQAMEQDGGILEVGLKDVTLDDPRQLSELDLKPGDYMQLIVSDNGIGIRPEIRPSIFEPYFTTKETGKGTGMGLAVVHGIVESYGGKISVESRPGKGSVFTTYFPIAKKRGTITPYVSGILPSGTERILFVDDEAPIVKMTSLILERLGYSVTSRTSSLESLERFRARPDDFDLVITDMTMPNMTGDKLAVELMKIRPDIPVIICTGYSNVLSEETMAIIGIKALNYKPIVKSNLAQTVRRVLDEAK